MEDLLSMADIARLFEVTDSLGIDRESLSVSLEKVDPGDAKLSDDGELEIVVPLSVAIEDWLPRFQKKLEELGFRQRDNNEE